MVIDDIMAAICITLIWYIRRECRKFDLREYLEITRWDYREFDQLEGLETIRYDSPPKDIK